MILCKKREGKPLPYKGYTNFYGFTPKFVLHFVGTDVLGGPLKQTARVIVTAANGQTVTLNLGRGGVSPPVYKQESMNGFSASHKSKNTNFVGEDIILPLSNKRYEQTSRRRTAHCYKL